MGPVTARGSYTPKPPVRLFPQPDRCGTKGKAVDLIDFESARKRVMGTATMSGRRSRDKEARAERALVRFLQNRGVAAEQVPLSGAAGGKFAGDISIPIIGRDLIAEVKVRGEGFRQVYGWLAGNDLLIIRVGLSEPLVFLPLELAAEVAALPERGGDELHRCAPT